MKKQFLSFCAFALLALTSCQKAIIDDEEPRLQGDKVEVKFNISQLEQIDFNSPANSRAQEIKSLCSRINLAVYKDGERVEQVNQKTGDKNYGSPSVALTEGRYFVAILAHSSTENPTMTKPDKITFGRGMTDTFLWSDSITVKDNEVKDIKMHRVVAMFRLITTDNIPSNVKSMKFYYTGGSSTISAVTGLGNANSKQTEVLPVSNDMIGKPGKFEVYTFPKDDENVLSMKITAQDAAETAVQVKSFEDVPISRNKITQYNGEFFTDSGTGDSKNIGVTLTTDDEWTTIAKTF